MCYHPLRVKTVAPTGSRFQYVPCGHCEECRNVQRFGWSFRLSAELQHRAASGWQAGFITLTYAPEYLPTLDPELFDEDNPPTVSCFDRQQVRDYIASIRKYLHRHYRVTELVYMICSEYGKRGRPHYHMVICWPPAKCVDKCDCGNSPVLDDTTMFRLCRDAWKSGFVFPQYKDGGFDGKYFHKPFLLKNVVTFAAKYCSKYCCKDINFEKTLSSYKLIDTDVLTDELKLSLKNASPFHLQSRSLGWSLVRDMSDSQKLDILFNGYCFYGNEDKEKAFEQIPLYIRNKLYFNPDYQLTSDGRRLVRRECSEFFVSHYKEIFSRKVDFYEDMLKRISVPDFWSKRGITDFSKSQFFARSIRERVASSGYSCRELSEQFVAWFGVWPAECYDVPAVDQWFSRYTDYWLYVDDDGVVQARLVEDPSTGQETWLSCGNDYDFRNCSRKSEDFINLVNSFWHFVFDTLCYTNNWIRYHDDVADIQDYYRKYLDEQDCYRVFQTVDYHLKVG